MTEQSAALVSPNQRANNPLDRPVGLICDNKEFLNESHVSRLMAVFPENLVRRHAPANVVRDDTLSDGMNTLMQQLQSMMKMHDRMMRAATATEDPDTHKRALAAGKDLFNLFAKFEEQIDRQSRQRAIEMSVKEAFAELKNPDAERLFLAILREKLVSQAQSK